MLVVVWGGGGEEWGEGGRESQNGELHHLLVKI